MGLILVWNFVKKYSFVLLMVLVCLIVINEFQSCGLINKPGTTIVQPLKTYTPTAEERAVIPAGDTAIGSIHIPKARVPNRWHNTNSTVVVSTDSKCNTCPAHYTEITKVKTYIGLSLAPKFFLGYSNNGLQFGYDQELFRVSRFSLDGLVSFPSVGVSIDYNITNNFFVLGGLNYNYLSYSDIRDISTYTFKLGGLGPIVGVGFYF